MNKVFTIWAGFKLGIGIYFAMLFMDGMISFLIGFAKIIVLGLGYDPGVLFK